MAPSRPPGFGESSTGWTSDFRTFRSEPRGSVIDSLRGFVRDASPEQVRAWSDSVPRLQQEVGEIVEVDAASGSFAAILEYELPLESRRPDAILLLRSGVLSQTVGPIDFDPFPKPNQIGRNTSYDRKDTIHGPKQLRESGYKYPRIMPSC